MKGPSQMLAAGRVGTNNAEIEPRRFKTSLSGKHYVNPFPPFSHKEAVLFSPCCNIRWFLYNAAPAFHTNLISKLLFFFFFDG